MVFGGAGGARRGGLGGGRGEVTFVRALPSESCVQFDHSEFVELVEFVELTFPLLDGGGGLFT